jgi:hypothetical protein
MTDKVSKKQQIADLQRQVQGIRTALEALYAYKKLKLAHEAQPPKLVVVPDDDTKD